MSCDALRVNVDDDDEMQYAGPVRPITLKKADIMKIKAQV